LAIEVGGRWSTEARDFVRALAKARARGAPALLQAAAEGAWFRRWTALLAVAAQSAFASTLLGRDPWWDAARDGGAVSLSILLDSAPVEDAEAEAQPVNAAD
jgi:hypothetical protein